jgi:hypothetical protein
MRFAMQTRPALFAASLLGLSACTSLPQASHWVEVKPIRRGDAPAQTAEAGYYAAAVTAIDRRDYARALDLLQVARARKPDDVKVLNAFGVVYDKLGRFDLSARYYAQAKALDAASPILAANIAYSAELQHRAEAPQLAMIPPAPAPAVMPGPAPVLAMVAPAPAPSAMAPPTPTPVLASATVPASASAPVLPPTVAAVLLASIPTSTPPGVIRLGFAAPGTSTRTLPLLTGGSLRIADASGRAGGAEPTRARLARLGWSASKAAVRTVAPRPRTTITYATYRAADAKALARTLPRGVRLVNCQDDCRGIRLTLGADSLSWRLPPARRPMAPGART